MAKLVIALCMLIVACSAGKLDSVLGNAEQVIVDKITEYREKIDEAVKQVKEYLEKASENRDKFIEKINKKIQEAIEEIEERGQVAAQCLSDVADLKSRAEQIVESLKSCSSEALAAYQKSYDDTIAAFDEFKAALAQIEADYEQCLANEGKVLVCARETAQTLDGEVLDKFNSLADNLGSYAQNYLKLSETLDACLRTTGYPALLEQLQDASDKVNECIAASEKE